MTNIRKTILSTILVACAIASMGFSFPNQQVEVTNLCYGSPDFNSKGCGGDDIIVAPSTETSEDKSEEQSEE